MDKSRDIYRELQKHMDTLPVGFPATESGVEIRILKRFFTPREAEVALGLGFIPQPLDAIYARVGKTGISRDETRDLLDSLVKKGAINGGKNVKTGVMNYSSALLAVGIFEYQVGRLTREFMEDFEQYMEEGFRNEFAKASTPQLRTIPIRQSIKPENFISTYDDATRLIETLHPISVSNCVCREGKALLGKPCSHTRETCFQFGGAARFYIEQGLGREVSREEALRIIAKSQEEGLVLQPGNSQKPFAICCCCGCCCEMLINLKSVPDPSKYFSSNHFSAVDAGECTGCGACADICPMEAIEMVKDIADIDLTRCIGCGVCVPRCPVDALSLQKKKNEQVPPGNSVEMFMKIMSEKNQAGSRD